MGRDGEAAMAIAIVLSIAALVGVLAQLVKRRTGAGWGSLTLAFMLPIWFYLDRQVDKNDVLLYMQPHTGIVIALAAAGFVGIIMALVILTLPSRRGEHR